MAGGLGQVEPAAFRHRGGVSSQGATVQNSYSRHGDLGPACSDSLRNFTGASLGRRFYVTEKKYLDFRVEFFNALNYVSLGPPGRDITTPATFGWITSQIGSPRNLQFGLKYCF